jgi:hypothetical protein
MELRSNKRHSPHMRYAAKQPPLERKPLAVDAATPNAARAASSAAFAA